MHFALIRVCEDNASQRRYFCAKSGKSNTRNLPVDKTLLAEVSAMLANIFWGRRLVAKALFLLFSCSIRRTNPIRKLIDAFTEGR